MADELNSLYDETFSCLMTCEPFRKVERVRALLESWRAGRLHRESGNAVERVVVPGRPDKPQLVPPSEVPRRSLSSVPGRTRFVHAIAHIEFNAINLALDAVYRFRNMPEQYFSDWLLVAAEEASHFMLLTDYLDNAGSAYGEFSAHNGLWEMAVKTDHDVLVRMALVPRVLEARGLDVTAGMIRQLHRAGDRELVGRLETIFHDEIGHVRIGSHWFNYCCNQRGLIASDTFFELLQQYMGRPLPGPFEMGARKDAGFSERELQQLALLAGD